MLVGGIDWWELPLGLVAVPLIVTLGHAALVRRYPDALREIDQLGACATAVLVAPFLIVPYTSDATWLWLGASMLVAAARGYAGCEVLAISSWLLRRDDTVGCLLIAPIDQAEAGVRSAGPQDTAQPQPNERSRHHQGWLIE